jgi:hypothetical protein
VNQITSLITMSFSSKGTDTICPVCDTPVHGATASCKTCGSVFLDALTGELMVSLLLVACGIFGDRWFEGISWAIATWALGCLGGIWLVEIIRDLIKAAGLRRYWNSDKTFP